MNNNKLNISSRPVVLCILDGWGIGPVRPDNAIAAANTPFWDSLLATYPHAELSTSGHDVGLPDGQMGNSEVGHMNIGGGRIITQDLPRIDAAIESGELRNHPTLRAMIDQLKKQNKTCHLLGLVSDGGVHAHIDHIIALARIVGEAGVPVAIHAFLDGRDTPPSSALSYVARLEEAIAVLQNVSIATLSGRYYAMDRDTRWERVEKAYLAIAEAQGEQFTSAKDAIVASYQAGKTDEFVIPVVLGNYKGVESGDGILMANFRSDRAREILTACVDPAFQGFARTRSLSFSSAIGMVEYSKELNAFLKTLFAPQSLANIFPEIVAASGLSQLRIAETEKYAHVTFFFSGGREEPFPGEERILIPSPKVATYDMQPEMSAKEVTEQLLKAVQSNRFDVMVVNYANGDMVGHTGDMEAAKKAVETIDHCLSVLVPAVIAAGGVILITADHGNAEMMEDKETDQPHTAHTTNPVPVILAGNAVKAARLHNGRLADVAPTLLDIMGLPIPKEMTGKSLIQGV